MKQFKIYRVSKSEKKLVKTVDSSVKATIAADKIQKKIAKEIYASNGDTYGLMGDKVVIEEIAA